MVGMYLLEVCKYLLQVLKLALGEGIDPKTSLNTLLASIAPNTAYSAIEIFCKITYPLLPLEIP